MVKLRQSEPASEARHDRSFSKARKRDVVAEQLAAHQSPFSVSTLHWVRNQRERNLLRRRTRAVVVGGWLLVLSATVVSAVVSWQLTQAITKIMYEFESGGLPSSARIHLLPYVLSVTSLSLFLGGLTLAFNQRVPGLANADDAIDWATAGDAIHRMLVAGTPRPDAFRHACAVVVSRRNCRWLKRAAERIEAGETDIATTAKGRGDLRLLETFLSGAAPQSDSAWKLASEYFTRTAKRRATLLIYMVPTLATITAGLVLWLSLTATLGWMSRSTFSLIDGFRY